MLEYTLIWVLVTSFFSLSLSLSLSAGVGRTGCFIVIDAMLERVKQEKTIDIYGHVTLMRSHRNYMVQTEEQYVFIYDALLEAVSCGNTEVPARNLYAYIQRLSQTEPPEHISGWSRNLKSVLPTNVTWIFNFCNFFSNKLTEMNQLKTEKTIHFKNSSPQHC